MITVTAIGRIGRLPELKQVGQSQVLSFPLAVERPKKKDQQKADTDWYSVEIWGARATALQPHLPVGQQVAISGRQELQTFTKQDGTNGFKAVINCNDFAFAGPKPAGAATPSAPAVPPPAVSKPATTTANDLDAIFASADEIPF